MDILEKTLLFGNDFLTTTNPARLVPFKFEIYRSEQGFYHRIYKQVGMSGANFGQTFEVWLLKNRKVGISKPTIQQSMNIFSIAKIFINGIIHKL
ncbi:hypothetical protein AB6G29_11015 [Providencia hangzhouensis]|uniref:hypothetical protein n=1 Tax=Providencia hangzhouensis TaxID=3031799 RepID=UPI0034DCD4D4